MKSIAATVMVVLSSLAAAAENPAEVLARLRSPDPSEVAWGAYFAGRDGLAVATPALLDALRPHPDRASKEWRFARHAVLDALVRLDVSPPLELVTPYQRGKHGWVPLILLTRRPEQNRAVLLDRFDRTKDSAQLGCGDVAIGNLLCTGKAPGFAARLMARVEMRLALNVRDAETLIGGHSDSRFLNTSGDGRVDLPEGFPPYALYELEFSPGRKAGIHLLADGPRPVSWTRKERKGPRIGFGSTGRAVPTQTLAREWLALLTGVAGDRLALPARTTADHVWETPESYASWAGQRRDILVLGFWRTARRLIRCEALTVEEARMLEPRITIRVRDGRKDQTVAIPPVPESELLPSLPAADGK